MPGGFSPLYARMDEAAGFESFFVAGSQTSAFMYGVPDMGLVGLRDIRELEEQFLPRRLKRDYVTTFGH